jgi:5-methylthioribose kinase
MDQKAVRDYLRELGLIGAGEVAIDPLTGGVSSDVLLIRSQGRSFVVKQALGRLRVAATWRASVGRSATEAAALEFAGSIQPDAVPKIFGSLADRHCIVMEAAPSSFRVWKSDLLAGQVEPSIAETLGLRQGAWHSASLDNAAIATRFADLSNFIDLRLEPFHRTVAVRHPQVSQRLEALAGRLLENRRCLVHGDLSPKNILTDGSGLWLVDWEAAHFGDPVFDLAFIWAHLRCKAAYRPESAVAYRNCAYRFLDGYAQTAGTIANEIDRSYLTAQIAALLLARMDGKSPVEYLEEDAKNACRQQALRILTARHLGLDDVWEG